MNNKLLILRPVKTKNKPTKTLDKNLKKVEDFNAGLKFYFKTLEYDNFHDAMKTVFDNEDVFIVSGELTEIGKEHEDETKAGRRLKRGGEATIQDRDSTEIVLDLDDHIIKGFDALKPHKSVKAWLKERNINCDVTVQITSSQQLNSEEARIRLYFTSSKPLPLLERKAWSQSPEIGADGCVYTCSQPIYTSPPNLKGGIEDPIKKRNFFLKGTQRTFDVPKQTKAQINTFNSMREISEYDYAIEDLPDEVLSGEVYRRYFMPMAFSLVNKGLDRSSVFGIIKHKAQEVTSREFNPENVFQYIDTALDQYSKEEHKEAHVPVRAHSGNKFPDFPVDWMSGLPEPFPMIWENIKGLPRVLEEPLLVPTILGLLGHSLHSNFVTAHNRRPNLFYLNLTPSTGNKDVNSKNVIRDLDRIFVQRGMLSNLFSDIVTTESNITADTSFLQSFNEHEEFFWINTEATRIFQMMKQGNATNSNVAAVSDKLIEVVDGFEITGKTKANSKQSTIKDPKCQILFYAQPETIERYIDENTVDTGLFGRSLITILPELKFNIEEYDMFMEPKKSQFSVTDEFYEFFSSAIFSNIRANSAKTILKPDEENRKKLARWGREIAGPSMQKNDTYYKVLSRLGNTGEQLYTLVAGICRVWDLHNKIEPRDNIPVDGILPLLTYWCQTKVYAIETYINTSLDPLADEVEQVIMDILSGDIKMMDLTNKKIVNEKKMVPLSQLMRVIKNRKNLIRKLDDANNKRDAVVRIERIIDSLERNDVLIVEMIGKKKCVGFRK